MNMLLGDLRDQVKIGSRQVHENMIIFSLMSDSDSGVDFITLDDALNRHSLEITEISEGGSVPTLRLHNPSSKRILALDGEEVIGAKQNRVLNATILVPPYSKTAIPVSCVEQGRWSYKDRTFSSASNSMSANLRQLKARSVAENLRHGRFFESNQAEVWAGIDRQYERLAVNQSPTMAMSDLYESMKPESSKYLESFSPQKSQIGMIVMINMQIAGMELINSFDAFRSNFVKLVNSYVLDAVETTVPDQQKLQSSRNKASRFLKLLEEVSIERRPSVALGNDLRIDSRRLTGSGLEYEDKILQLSLFPAPERERTATVIPLRRASERRRQNRR